MVPGGERQREMAFRTGVNIVMYALTGNYKADQVHVPACWKGWGSDEASAWSPTAPLSVIPAEAESTPPSIGLRTLPSPLRG